MANPIIAPGISRGALPGPGFPDRATLAGELADRATTVYHPVGTCRMGSTNARWSIQRCGCAASMALRVADASIMPSIIGGNTNAPSMMIGEHAASLIL